MPMYVLKIDADAARVTVGPRGALGRVTLTASDVNWMVAEAPGDWLTVSAQIRHRHRAAPGRVRALPDRRAELCFDEAQPELIS